MRVLDKSGCLELPPHNHHSNIYTMQVLSSCRYFQCAFIIFRLKFKLLCVAYMFLYDPNHAHSWDPSVITSSLCFTLLSVTPLNLPCHHLLKDPSSSLSLNFSTPINFTVLQEYAHFQSHLYQEEFSASLGLLRSF